MKRVFFGVTYLLLIVMMFTYLLIPCMSGNSYSILYASANTGLSVIGFLFSIPAFVFTIIALSNRKNIFDFIRDMLSLFTSIFILASAVIACTKTVSQVYIPVILITCCVIMLILSANGVIQQVIEEDKRKKAEIQEMQSAEERKREFDLAVERKVKEALKAKEEDKPISEYPEEIK